MRSQSSGADLLAAIAVFLGGCGGQVGTKNPDIDMEFGRRVTVVAARRGDGQAGAQAEAPAEAGRPQLLEVKDQARPKLKEEKPDGREGSASAAEEPKAKASGQKIQDAATESDVGRDGDGRRRPAVKSAPEPSEAAFPGRPARQAHVTPAGAAAAARAKLRLAAAESRGGDAAAACKLAVEAYAVVAAHAANDDECRQLAEESERLIERQGRMSRPANVPTRFD